MRLVDLLPGFRTDRAGGRRAGPLKSPHPPHLGRLPFHISNAPLNLLTLFFFFAENFLSESEAGKKGRGIKASVKLIK